MKDKTFEFKNPGPVKEFTLKMDKGPGVYTIGGPNGAGKSSTLRALARALGHSSVPVNLRRGAKTLSVELDGENLLEMSKVKPTGDIENALIKASPLARFVLPGMSDDNRNEAARTEAFFELVDIPVTEDAIGVLVQGNSSALAYVFEKEGDGLLDEKIVDAADKVRRRVHELKRQYETEGVKAQADIDANPVKEPEVVSKLSAAQAKEEYEAKVRAQERLRGQAEQREAQERQIAEITANRGERPDLEAATNALQETRTASRAATDIVIELEKKLAVAKSQETTAAGLEVQASRNLERVRAEQLRWDKDKDLLGAEITGATRADLEAAVLEAEEAGRALEHARSTENWKLALERRQQAQKRREEAYASAATIEKIATAVTAQLALLFEEAGVEGLTIEEGRICVIGKDGGTEPVYELSVGERSKIGIELMARNKFPHDVGILPGVFWQNLDEMARAEVRREVSAAGLYFVTEEPAEGELRVMEQPMNVVLEGQGVEDTPKKQKAARKAKG